MQFESKDEYHERINQLLLSTLSFVQIATLCANIKWMAQSDYSVIIYMYTFAAIRFCEPTKCTHTKTQWNKIGKKPRSCITRVEKKAPRKRWWKFSSRILPLFSPFQYPLFFIECTEISLVWKIQAILNRPWNEPDARITAVHNDSTWNVQTERMRLRKCEKRMKYTKRDREKVC